MKKRGNKQAVLISRRRTLVLCFIGGVMCYFMTILGDYIVSLISDYFNATEIFVIKLVIAIFCGRIGLKEIERMDLSDDSTFMQK